MSGVQVDTEDENALRIHAGKYLTFRLDNEDYGIQILKVQEIIGIQTITKVPRTPAFIRGVINLRGKVIPVVDLRSRFHLAPQGDTERTCIIVLQISNETSELTMSVIVDEVSEVIEINADQLERAPEFGAAVDTSYIFAMGKVKEQVIMLLDADLILSLEEKAVLEEVEEVR